MDDHFQFSIYRDALILLGVAGLIVPLLYRFKVNPILGFLSAGVILGPHGLGILADKFKWLEPFTFVGNAEVDVLADLGIVFLLFIVGLELNFQRLKALRRLVFGLGSAQVVISAIVIGVIASLSGNKAPAAIIIGLALAVSSTAIIVDILSRERRLSTTTGRASFSILLMQDIAVVPTLFLVDALGSGVGDSLLKDIATALGQALVAVALIVIVGRTILKPFFHLVAATPNQELFVAGSLLVIILTGSAAALAGLSMGLGAFIAGILLSETEYRRAIENAIEPFKGLLLGIFFFTVGLAVDPAQIIANPLLIGISVVGLIAIKAAVVYPLARWFGIKQSGAIKSALLLGAGGEFAFVVIGLATRGRIIDPQAARFMLLVTALTMALLPLLAMLGRRLAKQQEVSASADMTPSADLLAGETYSTIVVGFGRVGTLVSDMLKTHGIAHLVIDQNPLAVTRGRKMERLIYYGNVADVEFLKTCGIDRIKTLILTIDDHQAIDRIVKAVRETRPDLPIIARARDALHAAGLYAAGVTDAVPETVEASLQLSEAALVANGVAIGPVIASIHERRDRYRSEFQSAMSTPSREQRGVRASSGAARKYQKP